MNISQMDSLKIFASLLLLFLKTNLSQCCFFPFEMQGLYAQQDYQRISNGHFYKEVNITEDTFSTIGQCYRKFGDHVIFLEGNEKQPCLRCYGVKQTSKNIILIKSYSNECYLQENDAIDSCRVGEIQTTGDEIVLYKTQPIIKEICPFYDQYNVVKYQKGRNEINCDAKLDSHLDSCPNGTQLSIRLNECVYKDREIKFECLGQWKDADNKNYIALMDLSDGNDGVVPKFRCAVIEQNNPNNEIHLILSSDASCNFDERLASKREIFTLIPKAIRPTITSPQSCNFDNNFLGNWEQLAIKSDELIFKDYNSFNILKMKCIQSFGPDKFAVLSRSQCGQESYKCIMIKSRSMNIIEFQVGLTSKVSYGVDVCNKAKFNETRWLTMARTDESILSNVECPTTGIYIGVLPDAQKVCSRLVTQCKSKDLLSYEVFACEEPEMVYEVRKYQCLGKWDDQSGMTFSYVKRLDIPFYECFVGFVGKNNAKRIFIEEAGENCDRNSDPAKYGMEMEKIGNCSDSFDVDSSFTLSSFDGSPSEVDLNNVNVQTTNDIERKNKITTAVNYDNNEIEPIYSNANLVLLHTNLTIGYLIFYSLYLSF